MADGIRVDRSRSKKAVGKQRVDKANLVDDPKATAVKMDAMIINFFSEGSFLFLSPQATRCEGEVDVDWRL